MKRLLVALALSLFCVTPSHAQLSVPNLFRAAVELGGFEDACKRRERGCPEPAVVLVRLENTNHAGEFDYHVPTIIRMNAETPHEIGSPYWSATVVHEFVHYLQ